jgi:hypothetical protein
MPLVSLNTVNRWYRKDSWVYKNFTYLFQNPLWDTDVPKGFSLCPYFWLAIFSMTLFRVFVGSVLLLRLLFKPFGGLLGRTDGFFRKVFNIRTSVPAVPTFFVTLVASAILGLLSLLGYGGYETYQSYAEASALPALFLPIIALGIAIPCWVYYGNNKYNSDRCRVENYVRLSTLVLAGLGAYLMPNELYITVTAIGSALWDVITTILGFLFITIWVYLWEGICFAASFLWAGFVSVSTWFLTGLAFIGVVGAFAWISDKLWASTDYARVRRETSAAEAAVDKLAERILEEIAGEAYQRDGFSGCTNRDSKYWRSYIYSVPEAVAIAYEYARKGTTVLPEDQTRRAASAALNTFELELKLRQERKAAFDEKCHAVSGTAEKVFKFIWRPFGAIFRGLGWLLKEIWTLLCLLFSLAKAKKQGACPYLKFTDAS